MLRFSKRRFQKSADKGIQRLLSGGHLDALDGKAVEEVDSEDLGTINYELDGEDWYLYPVYPEWCEDV